MISYCPLYPRLYILIKFLEALQGAKHPRLEFKLMAREVVGKRVEQLGNFSC
jgi:hypothetical protein